ncbi:MAG: lysylphosphatidylglycerol synthase transmembrane domain-containing protein [Gemmatimonadaceae bacterium]
MKLGWRGALGILLSVALLWWTLRDVEFAHVWDVLRHSNVWLFGLSALVATLLFPVRAIRWRYILEPVAEGLPLGSLFRATAIGMMVNNTVPARAGELARAYALSRETSRVAFPAALASLVIDRAFDAVVIVGMLVAAMWSPAFPGGNTLAGQPLSRVAGLVALAAAGLLTLLAVLAIRPQFALGTFDAVARRISPSPPPAGRQPAATIRRGTGVARSPRLALWILAGPSSTG